MDDFTRSMLAKPGEDAGKYEPYESRCWYSFIK